MPATTSPRPFEAEDFARRMSARPSRRWPPG